MDQFFSITLRQDASNLGNVTQVRESSPRNLFDMRRNDKTWLKLTPRFLAVVLEDKVMPSKQRMLSINLDLRCLGPRTLT